MKKLSAWVAELRSCVKLSTLFSVLVGTLMLSGEASAGTYFPDEYARRVDAAEVVSPLGEGLFGDQVNYYTGSTAFVVTDVSLPGNSSLPVAVGRTHNVGSDGPTAPGLFGEWDIDIPYLHGIFAQSVGWQVSTGAPSNRCSSVSTWSSAIPPSVWASSLDGVSGVIDGEVYWSGNRIHIPAQGDKTMLLASTATRPQPNANYKWNTNSNWYFSCLPLKSGAGEGFMALAPDGTRYYFDWMVSRKFSTLDKSVYVTPSWSTVLNLARQKVFIYPTRVEDRHGNWVNYTWSGDQLQSIEANDGRKLAMTYVYVNAGHNTGYKVSTVSDGSRTWSYAYSTSGFLTSVVLPDLSAWQLNTAVAVILYNGQYITGSDGCSRSPVRTGNTFTYRMTHPSGASAEFEFTTVRHARDRVTPKCSWDYLAIDDKNKSALTQFDTISLLRKKIYGPGLADRTWTVAYSAYNPTVPAGSWSDCSGCATTKKVEVTDTAGKFTRYEFSTYFGVSEGRLLKTEQGRDATTILRTETQQYDTSITSPSPAYVRSVGSAAFYRGQDPLDALVVPQSSNAITQDGTTFTSQVDVGCTTAGVRCFDAFARPNKVIKSSTLTGNPSKTDTTVYYDNLSKWVLGQTQSIATNGVAVSATTFDPATALPLTQSAFGKLQQTLTYNLTPGTDQTGTLATVQDGNNNVTTLSNWKRGIPQTIQHPPTPESPAGAIEYADVHDAGWVNWVKDENGHTTNYTYDPMGRLASIVYPINDTVAWNTTTLTFAPVATAEYGLPVGHWKQTTSTGNARKVSYFDALWRPVVTEQYDAANVADTLSQTVTRYDGYGHPVFQSFPLNNLSDYATVTQGTRSTYDALDRVTRVEQDSELGVIKTTTEYLPGFQRRITNPRELPTTQTFQAYDVPSYDMPVGVNAPQGVTTTIARDAFGKPTQVTRSGPGG